MAKAGAGKLIGAGVLKTLAFIFVSPLLGFLLGGLMMVAVAWVCRRQSPLKIDRWFRRLQLVSVGMYSLGHSGNDAQKTIGIIWMRLIAAGHAGANDKLPPSWVIRACDLTIGAGTIVWAWIFTIPAAALVSALACWASLLVF